jgi:hypothetical protein
MFMDGRERMDSTEVRGVSVETRGLKMPRPDFRDFAVSSYHVKI